MARPDETPEERAGRIVSYSESLAEERARRRREAERESVKAALDASGVLVATPEAFDRLIEALKDNEWERGCRCYPGDS